MPFVPYRSTVITVKWFPRSGKFGAVGRYEITAKNLRVPFWWNKPPWKLVSFDSPEAQSAGDEVRLAIVQLHRRLTGSMDQPLPPAQWDVDGLPWQLG